METTVRTDEDTEEASMTLDVTLASEVTEEETVTIEEVSEGMTYLG